MAQWHSGTVRQPPRRQRPTSVAPSPHQAAATCADLTGARLRQAKLNHADLSGAIMPDGKKKGVLIRPGKYTR